MLEVSRFQSSFYSDLQKVNKADVLFKVWDSKDLFLLIEIIHDNFSLYKLYTVYH